MSCSSDGSFFCHSLTLNENDSVLPLQECKTFEQEKPDSGLNLKDCKDLNDKDYSVEGEKKQKELDNIKSAGEKYKLDLKTQLQNLRIQRKKLIQDCQEYVNQNLIDIKDLDIDINIRNRMEKIKTERILTVEKEMQWQSEKLKIALDKLENKFLKDISVEYIEVSSFRSHHIVTSFRTQVLPSWLQQEIHTVHQAINSEAEKAKQTQNLRSASQSRSGLSMGPLGLTSQPTGDTISRTIKNTPHEETINQTYGSDKSKGQTINSGFVTHNAAAQKFSKKIVIDVTNYQSIECIRQP